MKPNPCPSHVLIVDDEDDMCWALKTMLASEGFEPSAARSAHEALEMVGSKPFQMAFVDLKLPDMEGIDLVARLREEIPELLCVLVSGYLYEDDEVVQRSLKTGLIAGFVGKPFLLGQIRDMLGLVVPGSRLP